MFNKKRQPGESVVTKNPTHRLLKEIGIQIDEEKVTNFLAYPIFSKSLF